MKKLNGKQNLRPEKSIYSYFVKFYRTTDTIYVEYTGYFMFLSCALVFPQQRYFEMSHVWDSAADNIV